ncbi:hypothetical protein JTE90_018119 [Oedothorax gibbosus]|uniref:PBZ-type domain-containing protein n=1 Tax=Oedothorax gibbosus TaxID=931172 RepID=A0AAV6V1L7_9ARAC|nr:hypothetical protein JTE90_018119 [Oedothorax gibbosus]
MPSDSDCTIDSDELEEIIARSQKELGNSPTPSKSKSSDKAQRRASFHDLSDSGSEDGTKIKKHKKKSDSPKRSPRKCKYGPNCTKKNPDHIQKYDHSEDPKKSKHKSSSGSHSSSEKSYKRSPMQHKESSNSEVSEKKDKRESDHSEHKKSKNKNLESNSSSDKSTKRNHKQQEDSSDSDSEVRKKKKKEQESPKGRPKCKYGTACYRKNPDHIREYDHEDNEERNTTEARPVPTKNIDDTLKQCRNYQFYLTKVNGIPQNYNRLALDIKDLLSLKDGTLVSSAQFNYCFDIEWLMQQYPDKYRNCPLTIVHGEKRENKNQLESSGSRFHNITFCKAKLEIPFGTHHTKMMFLLYKEGFRIVIHTSNIIENDWDQKTQGMWISPILPPLPVASATAGESPTNFKADLLEYVSAYGAPTLDEWCEVIKRHNFHKVRVFLIGSIPGRHLGSKKTSFGHLKLRKILNLHGNSSEVVKPEWSVVCQFSSIGSLGQSHDEWLTGEFGISMMTTKKAPLACKSSCIKLVYPSVDNVRNSLEGYPAGASLPYSIKVAQKQPYLKSFMHQWKSEKMGRSDASPHIKTYLRLSPDNSKMAWFLVTSANLSKAAWGSMEKKGTQFMIRSYELGVLFLPELFKTDFFSTPESSTSEISKIFPIPFDIPLIPYSENDQPWIWDIPHVKAPDRHGQMWCPP